MVNRTTREHLLFIKKTCLAVLFVGIGWSGVWVGTPLAADQRSGLIAAAIGNPARLWGHLSLTEVLWTALIGMGAVGILMAATPKKSRRSTTVLEKSDYRSRQILANIREVIWVVSRDFSHLDYVSPAYETIWSRSCESLYADPLSWMESILPDDRESVLGFIEGVKSGEGEGAAFPAFRIFRDTGEIRWIQARLFDIKEIDATGQLKAIVAQDVTRSHFFEAALRESEEKWRSLSENSPDQVMLADLDGHIVFANRGFLGHSKVDLIGKHIVSLLPDPFDRLVQRRLRRVILQTEPASCRIERVDTQGRKTYYELRMSPVTVNRQTVAVAVNSTEITQRVEQESILLESEAFHRTLIEESPTGISIQDFSAIEAPLQALRDSGVKDLRAHLLATPDEVDRLAGLVKLVRVNQATVDLFQAPSAEHMVGPLFRLLKQHDHLHFIDQLIAFSSGKDRYEGEARNLSFHGQTLHLMVRKVVINRSENGLSKILATLIDVTPIKTAEKERQALMLQLQQSQKLEAIGTLAGGVAHDFNNILSIILGNAELSLADIGKQNPAYTNIQEIRGASLRAKDIVQQLLGFSRRSDQQLKSTHLMPLVKESVKFLRATIPSNIAIQTDLAAADDVIRADATQIHQVMINLLANASHAMEETGGELSIRTDNVTLRRVLRNSILPLPAGRYVQIVVADTGMGIPDDVKGRIFDPYFTTKHVGKGTGMGLAVVHGIIKNYGGGIVLKTKPGSGTTFELYFPLAGEAADGPSSRKEDSPTGNERILFVDDEAMIVEIAEKILQRLGYRVHCCNDPTDALSLINNENCDFDLLITDMTMPGMTGDRLINEVHQLHPGLPVILCTGHSDRIPKHNIADLGIAAVLNKPVELNTLALAVRQVLDRSRENQ